MGIMPRAPKVTQHLVHRRRLLGGDKVSRHERIGAGIEAATNQVARPRSA